MKEIVLQYARYNVWANQQMTAAVLKMGDEGANQHIVSSFPSIRATVTHIWSAESIWLQRMKLVPQPVWPEAGFAGSISEACAAWVGVSKEIAEYVAQLPEAALGHVMEFRDRSGNPHGMQVWQVVQHVCNHATYHRGQLTTMLRQAGATDMPHTDFVIYLRRQE